MKHIQVVIAGKLLLPVGLQNLLHCWQSGLREIIAGCFTNRGRILRPLF